MRDHIEYILTMLSRDNIVIGGDFIIPVAAVKFLILLCLAALVHLGGVRVVLPLVGSFIRKTRNSLDDVLIKHRVLKRVFHLLPAAVLSVGLPLTFGEETEAYSLLSKGLGLYYILICLAAIDAVLSSVRDIYENRTKARKVGITGAIQALKVIAVFVAVVLAISILAGKSPVYFLSGLGAFTAILMLIFKDPIMGLVAGVQLSTMDLVRRGDWIEIPKHGADGHVEEITLTTVTVRNFDKTITAVPAYELVSSSFRNWRGMTESGGRRIKRSIRFSMSSIRFLTDEEIARLRKIKLLQTYFDEKLSEIDSYNTSEFVDCDMSVCVNGRRLTNFGTFRAYCDAYLRGHPGINKELMLMVRQLGPTEFGVPLEIYAFTKDVAWVPHENTQSDIFDHLLAILPEFGLVAYQR